MLKPYDNTFWCEEYQVPMLQNIQEVHPEVYADILKEVKASQLAHSFERSVNVVIYGLFEAGKCRRLIKTPTEFEQFGTFTVQPYGTHSSTVQNSEWITDTIAIHAD